jgi:hypothetical protein
MHSSDRELTRSAHSPVATPAQVAAEPAPFPSKTAAWPIETFFPDWRQRLIRNLSRRTDSRWDPLTWVHADESALNSARSEMLTRPFDDQRDTPLWKAVEAAMSELASSKEISINTAPEYVIGFLCRELVAKKLIVAGMQQ